MTNDLILRNVDRVVPLEDLTARLGMDRPLRVKLGLDPTAPAVTLGWAVVLRKLRQFQELGHTAVLIIGDFTAQVGDPSGRSETRRPLSSQEVRAYSETVLAQFGKVLLPEPLEVRYNSEWLASLDMAEILKLTSHVTVAQMLERGDFAKRLAAETPISLMEFLYPLLQGYDSVAVKADVELGGSDQLWNLMMGRIIQERYGMSPQVALTMPLLVGTDGVQKMSQSLDNYIGVSEPAEEMFGKVMSIDDDTMGEWFRLAADLDQAELDSIQLGLREESLHPREAKARLAKEIVTLYWGAEAAQAAEAAFNRVFRDRMAPGEIPSWQLPTEDPINLPGLLRAAGVVSSAGEGRRLITQGAVSLDGNVLKDENVRRETLVDGVLRIGKRRFLRLVV